jgi:hypothetical protein
MGYPITKNRMVDGGDTWEIEGALDVKDGGVQTVEDGGEVVLESGATLTVDPGATVSGLDGAATFASNAEALTGTEAAKNISPSTLAYVIAQLMASNAEALAGTLTTKFANPANLKYTLDSILGVQGATIVVGAEDTNKINVAIQLKDYSGDDLAVRGSVQAFLSDATAGEAAAATAPSGHVAVGTDGGVIHLVTDKVFVLTSEADGDIDIDITEAAGATWYLVIILPNGKRVVSDAITFAA